MSRPDLSKGAIKRAVLGGSLQHPAVVYPAALGVLGGVGALLVSSGPLVLGAAAVAGGAAALGFAINYFLRHDDLAGQYLARAHAAIVAQRETMLKDVEDDLKRYEAHEALRQLERLREKIATFQIVLGEKLSEGEITYGRFLGIAEEVFLSGVDNLRSISLALAAIDSTDKQYLNTRIAKLEALPKRSAGQEEELGSLRQQLQSGVSNTDKAERHLAQNERAMAELDRAITAIAEMRTSSQGTLDMEAAMTELARIAARAKDYEAT